MLGWYPTRQSSGGCPVDLTRGHPADLGAGKSADTTFSSERKSWKGSGVVRCPTRQSVGNVGPSLDTGYVEEEPYLVSNQH